MSLEDLRKAVVGKPEDRVFRMNGDFPKGRTVYWDGPDFQDFLRLSGPSEGSLIYLHEEHVGDEDPRVAQHQGQCWMVEVAFLRDGIFHVYQQIAPWAEELVVQAERVVQPPTAARSEAPELLAALRDNQNELVAGFLESLSTSGRAVEPSGYELRQQFSDFLRESHKLPRDQDVFLLWRANPEVESALRSLLDRIGSEIRTKERKIVEGLVAQCAQWARRNAMKTLTQSDVEVFLDEEKVPLSREARRLLWQKANFTLKSGRVPG